MIWDAVGIGDFKSGIAPLMPAIAINVVTSGGFENFKHNIREMGLEDSARKNLQASNRLPNVLFFPGLTESQF